MTAVGTSMPVRLIRLMQVIWIVLVVLNLVFFVLAIPAYHSQLLHPPLDVRSSLAHLSISIGAYAAYLSGLNLATSLVGLIVAVLIARHRFNEPMALVASLFLVEVAGSGPASVGPLVRLHPAFHLPADILSFLLTAAIMLFLFTFPNARFAPRWAGAFFALWLAGIAAAAVATRAPLYDNPPGWYGLALFAAFVGGVASQAYRYFRVSGTVERQQTKWVLFGMVIALTATFLSAFSILPSVGQSGTVYDAAGNTVVQLGFMFIPVTIGIAVTRYRLWDIDVLINRTLVYASLTITLGLVYVGGVVGLQALFRGLTGQGSGLAVAISTLAIAALFQPLRQNIQGFIDQRFYRRKYDATRTLARFGERVRDDVDLEELTRDVLGVVQETMQPSHVSLWLRERAQ